MCSAVPCPASCFYSTRGAPSPAALFRNGWNFLSGWSYPDSVLLLHCGPVGGDSFNNNNFTHR